ncbi:Asp-tRNA(Asn)/Glu-tRNA(Gln) amidotransferase subunit GatC [Caldisalinibacter kiritimatiensis]|uniref:Aspartyl/glutamyl-tRNA(Asn/Gln) amidotransferase subunit C n=1 Tax=Caldisalinibacter kiritimatiensis TaxID=1304284 RepID=R1AT38_9FIRM|nr:Asp-tRNA(Asn)/Glu-tRNA(Gln) amidotransferase subunit GatC [Caldisalinibacter kiritimatiensis]EOD00303.1 Aspartyl-tRNA(Asn) amidotransferase subunit C / Glutamyl-tRNA(Gln) amidotransferase subunit C [Caldisalinibacter kiritimatiensis]
MAITKEDVKHVAKLSRLEFSEDEIQDFTEKFASVLEYVDKLKEVDTKGVEPTYHPHPVKNVMREDVVKESLSREKALSNAPDKQNGYFKIPKVLG